MKKQFFSVAILFSIVVLTGFRIKNSEMWTATLKLEGKGKSYLLVSDAVYGGYNKEVSKFFLFGKNHMFQCKEDAAATKAFLDLCTLNGSGQFEFQLSGIENPAAASKSITGPGKLNFLKTGAPVQAQYKYNKLKGKEISVNGNFRQFGLNVDAETSKILSGNFSLTFTSNK